MAHRAQLYALIIGCLLSTQALAQDCLVSTDFRAIYEGSPNINTEYSDSKTGIRSVTFINGDSVLAHFAPCDLGISANYFSIEALAAAKIKAKVSELLDQVLPSGQVKQVVMAQLDEVDLSAPGKHFELRGTNDTHLISVEIPDNKFVFGTSIHYLWQPPER